MAERILTRCEIEVMEVLWDLGRGTVQDVMDVLSRDLAYTTVMTTLRILDGKQIVRRTGKAGRAFIYEPAVTRDEVQQAMTDNLAGTLFGGSAKSLVLSLLGSPSLSEHDIDELKRAIRLLEDPV